MKATDVDAQRIIERLGAVDPSVAVDKEGARRALEEHVGALGLSTRPVRWVNDPAEAQAFVRDRGWSTTWSAAQANVTTRAEGELSKSRALWTLAPAAIGALAAFGVVFVAATLLSQQIYAQANLGPESNPIVPILILGTAGAAAAGVWGWVRSSVGAIKTAQTAEDAARREARASKAWNRSWEISKLVGAVRSASTWAATSLEKGYTGPTQSSDPKADALTMYPPAGSAESAAAAARWLMAGATFGASNTRGVRVDLIETAARSCLPWVAAYESGLWLFWVLESEIIAVPRPASPTSEPPAAA